MQNGEKAREEGKEEGRVSMQTHGCQAPGPDISGGSPVSRPAPNCPGPAHLMQSFCKWLISFEVRRGPQSSLSRHRYSWNSSSLG